MPPANKVKADLRSLRSRPDNAELLAAAIARLHASKLEMAKVSAARVGQTTPPVIEDQSDGKK